MFNISCGATATVSVVWSNLIFPEYAKYAFYINFVIFLVLEKDCSPSCIKSNISIIIFASLFFSNNDCKKFSIEILSLFSYSTEYVSFVLKTFIFKCTSNSLSKKRKLRQPNLASVIDQIQY